MHDPDGILRDHEYRQRHRDLRYTQHADGSGSITIDATAELMERLLTTFDCLAQPLGPRPTARKTPAPQDNAATTPSSTS